MIYSWGANTQSVCEPSCPEVLWNGFSHKWTCTSETFPLGFFFSDTLKRHSTLTTLMHSINISSYFARGFEWKELDWTNIWQKLCDVMCFLSERKSYICTGENVKKEINKIEESGQSLHIFLLLTVFSCRNWGMKMAVRRGNADLHQCISNPKLKVNWSYPPRLSP